MNLQSDAFSALRRIGGGLVVSCQPVPGGPMDTPPMVVGFALAALRSGAKGLRIEGLDNLRAVRQATDAPIIGLIKRDLPTSPVRITPLLEDASALAAAGADIIAFDATERTRPVPPEQLCKTIRELGRIAMADVSNLQEANAAVRSGAHVIGTTLSGYTGGPEPEAPDFDLLEAATALPVRVIAEGCVRTPAQARRAIELGAHAVVVGSAITRPEHITSWFVRETDAGLTEKMARSRPVLGIDVGGTKTIVSLVSGSGVESADESMTLRHGRAEEWCDAIAETARRWRGQFALAAAAVTGIIDDGRWSALNAGTLAVPDGFPLEAELSRRLGVAVSCYNDAQASAWGEHRFGAGHGADLVFLTVSSGIGGGIVQGGRLLAGHGGLAGSVGSLRIRHEDKLVRIEDLASGLGIARAARALGHDADARSVFAHAGQGDGWARALVETAASRIAEMLQNLQLVLDPPLFVMGGSVGLASGFIDLINARLAHLPAALRPEIRAAALGKYAGVIGAADLARHQSASKGG